MDFGMFRQFKRRDGLSQVEEDLVSDRVVAELNSGELIPPVPVMSSLKILPHQVIPSFK